MNKTILAIVGSFLAGTASGFILGYTYMKNKSAGDINYYISQLQNKQPESQPEPKKEEKSTVTILKEAAEKKEEPVLISNGPAKIAMPGEPGVDYSAYSKKVEELKYRAESEAPTDGDDTELEEPEDSEIEETMETYDERVSRELEMVNDELSKFMKTKGAKGIYVIGKTQCDPEWPDIRYDAEEILYFISDDVITDSFGNYLDEEETVGKDLRRYGWYVNSQEDIWVRNVNNEVDYHIVKVDADYLEYFPSKREEVEE